MGRCTTLCLLLWPAAGICAAVWALTAGGTNPPIPLPAVRQGDGALGMRHTEGLRPGLQAGGHCAQQRMSASRLLPAVGYVCLYSAFVWFLACVTPVDTCTLCLTWVPAVGIGTSHFPSRFVSGIPLHAANVPLPICQLHCCHTV